MSIEQELKKIITAEEEWHKAINNEIALENEIKEVSEIVANTLKNKPMALMCIQNRTFVVIAATYHNNQMSKCIQLVAREKTEIVTAKSNIIKANLVVDTNYTMKENLTCGIKALLGHITGLIKPEVL